MTKLDTSKCTGLARSLSSVADAWNAGILTEDEYALKLRARATELVQVTEGLPCDDLASTWRRATAHIVPLEDEIAKLQARVEELEDENRKLCLGRQVGMTQAAAALAVNQQLQAVMARQAALANQHAAAAHTNIQSAPKVETPTPEKPASRDVTRRYVRPSSDPGLVRRCLDLCAAGRTNEEISAELNMSVTSVGRIRRRSDCIQAMWPTIDAWLAQHPTANLEQWRMDAVRKAKSVKH